MLRGRCWPIQTDFRVGLILWEEARAQTLTLARLGGLYFPEDVPEDLEEAAEGVRRFFLRRDEPAGEGGSGPIPYDFRLDRDRILAGFQEHYGLDLTDPGLSLHWWRFMALLEGLLGPDLGTLADIRTRDLRGMDPAARQEFLRLRRSFAIQEPRETLAEHLQHLDEIIARNHTLGGERPWQTAESS